MYILKKEFSYNKNTTVKHLIESLALIVLIALAGCQKKEDKVTIKEVKKETNEAMKASANFIEQKKEKKLQQLTKEMNKMQEKLEALRSKAEDKLDKNMQSTIEALQKRQENFESALREFQRNTNSAWEETTIELDNALKELDEGYKKALNQISLENSADKDKQ